MASLCRGAPRRPELPSSRSRTSSLLSHLRQNPTKQGNNHQPEVSRVLCCLFGFTLTFKPACVPRIKRSLRVQTPLTSRTSSWHARSPGGAQMRGRRHTWASPRAHWPLAPTMTQSSSLLRCQNRERGCGAVARETSGSCQRNAALSAEAAGRKGVRAGEGRGPPASQRCRGGCGGHVRRAEACRVHLASRQRQVCSASRTALGSSAPLRGLWPGPGDPLPRGSKVRAN